MIELTSLTGEKATPVAGALWSANVLVNLLALQSHNATWPESPELAKTGERLLLYSTEVTFPN